jgi:hypothetical protein
VEEAPFWDEWKLIELELSEAIRSMLPQEEPLLGMIVGGEDRLELMPIRVQEHAPDILGPRIIDELRHSPDATRPGALVRHIVKGLAYEEWTDGRLAELANLVCAKPFRHDPLRELADGEDWIAWKTRNGVLGQPAAADERLRQHLVEEVFTEQTENGSWADSVVKTAYGILRALSVHVPPDDARMQRAAEWLLDWPQPVGRPGMWMLTEEHLREWNAIKRGELQTERDMYFDTTIIDKEQDLFRAQEPQEVIPTCCRNFTAMCYSRMLHPSATVAAALCRCGYAEHSRVKDYANTILQVGGMFGYFCGCWGIVDYGRKVEDLAGKAPDFDQRTDEYEVALKSLYYGYARDGVDLCVLARRPHYPGVHRPDLADTNGWWPYDWKDIGMQSQSALIGSYWQNADCWSKTNRALSQFPGWPGSVAEFLALFQLHLYQTPLGEWNQGFPPGILRWIAEVTRNARARRCLDDTPALRFARMIVLKSIPWLREHQQKDGLWDHEGLPRFGGGQQNRPPNRRLGSYHIVAVLDEFGLLERMCPS